MHAQHFDAMIAMSVALAHAESTPERPVLLQLLEAMAQPIGDYLHDAEPKTLNRYDRAALASEFVVAEHVTAGQARRHIALWFQAVPAEVRFEALLEMSTYMRRFLEADDLRTDVAKQAAGEMATYHEVVAAKRRAARLN